MYLLHLAYTYTGYTQQVLHMEAGSSYTHAHTHKDKSKYISVHRQNYIHTNVYSCMQYITSTRMMYS